MVAVRWYLRYGLSYRDIEELHRTPHVAVATSRPRHYPSDTSDTEWQALAPHVPAGSGRGRPVIYPRRDIVDAIRYLNRTGCQ
jgi:putative transposase of IS4/5 family DUF4096